MGVQQQKGFDIVFFETANERQPVKDFINNLTKGEQREISADIRLVQEGFPIGLPLVRKLKPGLWEIRSIIRDGICRVFFSFVEKRIIILHAIVKKTQKTPLKKINTAIERLKEFKRLRK